MLYSSKFADSFKHVKESTMIQSFFMVYIPLFNKPLRVPMIFNIIVPSFFPFYTTEGHGTQKHDVPLLTKSAKI